MGRNKTVIMVLTVLLIIVTFLCVKNYTQVKHLKRSLSIEQTKLGFVKNKIDMELIPYDSVYVSNTDTVYFYKNGEYLGKSITITE